MRQEKIGARWVAGLMLMGALLRLAYGLACPPQMKGQPLSDPDGYVGLASSVAENWSLYEDGKPSAHREPLFPIFLGILFKLFGKHYGVLLLGNICLGIAALYGLYRIGSRLFGEKIGWIALAVAAVYPPFIFYAAQPFRETAMLAVSAAALGSILSAHRCLKDVSGKDAKTLASFAGAGAVSALAALTNSTFLPFSMLVPVGIVLLEKGQRMALRCAGLYLVVLVLLYAIWPVRNYHAFKTWVMGSTAGAGSTFYLYLWIPQEIGGTPLESERIANDPVQSEAAKLPSIVEKERFYWKAAVDWVSLHPGRYCRLVAWRFFVDTWRVSPRPRAYAHSNGILQWVAWLSDGWILPLGLLGMVLVRFRPVFSVWIYCFVFSMAFTYSLIFSMLRYRLSMMPWIILFAAAALRKILDSCKPRGT